MTMVNGVTVQLYQDLLARYSYHTCINKKLWMILLFQSKVQRGVQREWLPATTNPTLGYVHTFSLKTKTERSIICSVASGFALLASFFCFVSRDISFGLNSYTIISILKIIPTQHLYIFAC